MDDNIVPLGFGGGAVAIGIIYLFYVKVLKGKLKKRVLRGD